MQRRNDRAVQLAPTVSTTAYASGNVIGGLQTVTGLGTSQARGLLRNVTVGDADNQKAPLTLLFFRAAPTGSYADGAAPALTAADLANLVAVVSVAATDYTTVNTAAVACVKGPWVVVGDTTAGQVAASKLWVVIVSGGTPTFTGTGNLKVTLGIEAS